MEEKLKQYITSDKFNSVVYELKTEIRETQVASDKMYTELKNSNESLLGTLTSLNNSISDLNVVMTGIREDNKGLKNEVHAIERSNIDRDYKLKELDEFKEAAEKHISGRFKEVVGLVLGIGSIASGIIIAIINLAPIFF